MLRTKFRGNRSTGSGDEDFDGILPYVDMTSMLVMWPRCREQTFFPTTHRGSTQNLALIGRAVSEKKDVLLLWTSDDPGDLKAIRKSCNRKTYSKWPERQY